jgi:hypothetical protein
LSQFNSDGDNGRSGVKLTSAITTASGDKYAGEKKEKDRTAFCYKNEKNICFIPIG